MSPMQIKVAVYGGAALLLWLFARSAAAASKSADPGRVTKTLEVDADVYSPTFGMSDAEIEAAKAQRANPAVDPEMRRLIDVSNKLLSDDLVQSDADQ